MGTFINNVKSAQNLDLANFVKKIVKLKLNLRYLAKSKQTLTCFLVLLDTTLLHLLMVHPDV